MSLYVTYGIDKGRGIPELKNYCFSLIYASIKAVFCIINDIRFGKYPVFFWCADILKPLSKTVPVIMNAEHLMAWILQQPSDLLDNEIPGGGIPPS